MNALRPAGHLPDQPGPGLLVGTLGYLRDQGIGPETVAAFRIGTVSDADVARICPGQRKLTRAGLNLPTFDPRHPGILVGVIRLTPAQHLHRHIGPPAGIAAAPGLADAPRVVLVDNPLLGLRLHERGVAGIAIVEDPAVLAPLTDWLGAREVVTITTAKRGDLPLPAGIVPVGTGRITGGLECAPAAVLVLLGLDPTLVRPVAPPPPVTPRLLHDLMIYAQGRLAAGDAQIALAAFDADIPDLVTAYRIGYLPADYRAALSSEAQRMLIGRRFGNALVLPAFDEARAIVDLLVVRTNGAQEGMWPEPRGLLAPEVLHGQTTLRVTASVRTLARLFAQGHRDVLLLRGVDDARSNTARIAAAGVEQIIVQAQRQSEAIAAVLRATGLRVIMDADPVHEVAEEAPAPALISEVGAPAAEAHEVAAAQTPTQPDAVATLIAALAAPVAPPPSPVAAPPPDFVPAPASTTTTDPQALTLVEVERDGQVALFQAGPVRYAVTLRDDGLTQRRVVVRAHGKSCTHDLDLAVPAQRVRTASGAARQVGLPVETVAAHLVALLAGVQALEAAEAQTPAVAIAPADRAAAEEFLAAPDLLERIAADLTALGWVAEDCTKHLLYLTAISRLLPHPVWAVYRASTGAAPWQGLGCIAALTPPESRVIFHRVTDAALTQADRASLQHRLLIVDQAETLRPEAALALRVLHERGGVGWAAASAGPGGSGCAPALLADWRGPVAVLAAAVGPLDHRCADCFLAVTVDESPEQTARILADQRQRLGAPATSAATHAAIISRHHAAQRLLARLPVRIPFADRIVFPASRVRHRDEQAWLLGLVAASALLHQRQRQRDGDAVVASEADFDHAVRCTAGLIGGEALGISAGAGRLLQALWAQRLTTFTMPDLAGLFPDWSRWTFRAALQDLCDFGHLTSTSERMRGGRGQRRSFSVTGQAAPQRGIHLRPVGSALDPEGGILAETGGIGKASLTQVRTGT